MDKTAVCNIALGHLGISEEIANIETERSEEASTCRRFFDLCLDEVMRDFNYPFANRVAALSLIEENPTTEWAYSYGYPSDCSRMIRILSGQRNDSRQSRIPYKIYNDSNLKVIHTDMASAYAEYTLKINDISLLTADAVSAFSLLLAFYMSPRLTSGDPFKLGERAYKAYIISKTKAEANAFNEQQDEEEVESEFIRSRE